MKDYMYPGFCSVSEPGGWSIRRAVRMIWWISLGFVSLWDARVGCLGWFPALAGGCPGRPGWVSSWGGISLYFSLSLYFSANFVNNKNNKWNFFSITMAEETEAQRREGRPARIQAQISERQWALVRALGTQREAKEELVKLADSMWHTNRLVDVVGKDYEELKREKLLPNGRPRTKAESISRLNESFCQLRDDVKSIRLKWDEMERRVLESPPYVEWEDPDPSSDEETPVPPPRRSKKAAKARIVVPDETDEKLRKIARNN